MYIFVSQNFRSCLYSAKSEAHAYVVLSSSSLEHSGEEASGEGETREPEEDGRMRCRGPRVDLLHALDQVARPCSQGFQRGIGLPGGA